MPPDDPFLECLRQTNTRRGLLTPGDHVLVAVSGGADSLALLHALHALRDELQIDLAVAHLHHRMRGAEGDADAEFVRETARAWGIPAETGSRDVRKLARRCRLSLEEAGRAARYRFFGRAARHAGCRVIATAHTADDRAETVLLHLLRGTGLDGLTGIPARRPLNPGQPVPEVVRPLIDVTRAQVLEYCARHRLQPRHDVTNDSPDFLRNRVRRELLPLLEADYSPAVRRHLLRLADLAEEETPLLNAQALELVRAAGASPAPKTLTPNPPPKAGGGGTVGVGGHESPLPQKLGEGDRGWGPDLRLSRAVLAAAPPALARRTLRLAVQSLQPGPPPELATVERLLSLARGERSGFILPGGRIAARVTNDGLILEPADPIRPFLPNEVVPLAVPGATPLPWCGSILIAQALERGGWSLSPDGSAQVLHLRPPDAHALLDRARVAGPLSARPPRPGDRIQPLGMAGHRKLQDLFTDRKIPRALRRQVPVVCDAAKIVWVAGCCVSETVRVTERTTEALLLEFRRQRNA